MWYRKSSTEFHVLRKIGKPATQHPRFLVQTAKYFCSVHGVIIIFPIRSLCHEIYFLLLLSASDTIGDRWKLLLLDSLPMHQNNLSNMREYSTLKFQNLNRRYKQFKHFSITVVKAIYLSLILKGFAKYMFVLAGHYFLKNVLDMWLAQTASNC